jgi:hypothetical protein
MSDIVYLTFHSVLIRVFHSVSIRANYSVLIRVIHSVSIRINYSVLIRVINSVIIRAVFSVTINLCIRLLKFLKIILKLNKEIKNIIVNIFRTKNL